MKDRWGEKVDTPVPPQTTRAELEELFIRFGIPMVDVNIAWDARTGAAYLKLRYQGKDYEYRSTRQKNVQNNVRAIKILMEAKIRAHKRGLEDFGVAMSPYLRLEGGSTYTYTNATPTEVAPEEKKAYAVLGVNPLASDIEIDAARKKLIKIYHPDRAPDEETRKVMEDKMVEINSAYELIKARRI